MTSKGKLKTVIIFSAILILLFSVFFVTGKSILKVLYPVKYTEYVEKYSAEYGIDETLIYAVIKTESSFNPEAVSNAEAVGLTQITPETFRWLKTKTGEENENLSLFDPETSVKYGAFFLRYLLDEFENTNTALAAYHAGRGRINGWLENEKYSPDGKILTNIPVKETAHYVNKVNKAIRIYEKLYDKQ